MSFRNRIAWAGHRLGRFGRRRPTYIEEEGFHRRHWAETPVPPPAEISVELSSRCDLRCATCSLAYAEDRGRDMDIEQFKRLLEQTAEFCSSYNLHGIGESLLHPHLVTCIELVKRHRALCRITTNGLRLVPALAEEVVRAGMDSVTFSVDAATAETYRRMRRSNKFGRLEENIRGLVGIRARLGRRRPVITAAFVWTNQNWQELPAFVDWASDVGADSAYVQSYDNRGWGEGYRVGAEDSAVTALEEANARAAARSIPLHFEYPARMDVETGRAGARELPVWDTDTARSTSRPRYSACEAPWVHGIVRANGNVDTCWFGETVGNIRERTFCEIWNGPRIREFRRRQRSLSTPPPPCCARTRGWHYCNPLAEIPDCLVMSCNDHAQLGLGWHVLQRDGDMIFRFTAAAATAFLRNSGKPRLLLRTCVYSPTGAAETRRLSVAVDGRRIGTLEVGTLWRDQELRLPRSWRRFIEVSLAVNETCIPCRIADSFDYRRLGVAVSRIALID